VLIAVIAAMLAFACKTKRTKGPSQTDGTAEAEVDRGS
jgi:hypothetical protein